MAGKSFRYHIRVALIALLRLVGAVVFLGGASTIAITFVIRRNPTFPAGWGFVALGVVIAISGVLGMFSTGGWGLCGCELLFSILASSGTITAAIIIFANTEKVLGETKYDGERAEAKQLLQANGALYLFIFVLHMAKSLVSCIINNCGLDASYEDIESQSDGTGISEKKQVKLQKEDDKRRAKIEASSAHVLAEKMKAKYGEYNSDPVYQK